MDEILDPVFCVDRGQEPACHRAWGCTTHWLLAQLGEAIHEVLDAEYAPVVRGDRVGRTLTVLYNITHPSCLPSVVTRENLVRANALIGASDAAAEIAGPSLAGTLMQWLSAPYAIFIDMGTYLFSAICLARIHAPEARPISHERLNVRREMIEGLRIVIHHPVLRALAGTTATHRFFGNFIVAGSANSAMHSAWKLSER